MTNQRDKIAADLAKALEPKSPIKKTGIGVTLNGEYMESIDQFATSMKKLGDVMVTFNKQINNLSIETEKFNGSDDTT